MSDVRIHREPARGSAGPLYLLVEADGTTHYARGWRAILSVARSLRCNSCGARPCICPTPVACFSPALTADEESILEAQSAALRHALETAALGDSADRVAELEEDLDSLEASRSALADEVQELMRERDELAAGRAECIEQLEKLSALAGVPFDTDAPERFARDLRGAVAGAVQLADARPATRSNSHPPDPHDGPTPTRVIGGVDRG